MLRSTNLRDQLPEKDHVEHTDLRPSPPRLPMTDTGGVDLTPKQAERPSSGEAQSPKPEVAPPSAVPPGKAGAAGKSSLWRTVNNVTKLNISH
jgi:hypothetical protein